MCNLISKLRFITYKKNNNIKIYFRPKDLIWQPYVVFIIILAIFSRIRNNAAFKTNWREKLVFFLSAPQLALCSLEFILQKSLGGATLYQEP